jgi:hypothetical protein
MFLVTIENFVAGFSGYPEKPADITHALAIQKAGNKSKTLFRSHLLEL